MLIGYVPGLRYAVSQGTGWRADSLGDYGHWSDTWCHMVNAYPQKLAQIQALEAWKRGPVAFEPPGSMRDLDRYVPTQGGSYDRMWDQALAWHGSVFNAKSGEIPAHQAPSIERFLKNCGYRFVLRRALLPQVMTPEQRSLPVCFEIENTGVAPVYRDYILAVKLEGGRQPIILESRCKPSSWLPGMQRVKESLPVPESLGAGNYQVSVGVLASQDAKPAIKLANTSRQADGWLPLSRLKVVH